MSEVWTTNADGSEATVTGRALQLWYYKINPGWWLVGDDGWNVPTMNNGDPYLPTVTNIWLRRFYWFVCRNPLMNFVGYVIGVNDRNYTVTGSPQVLLTTGRDATPPVLGWRYSVINLPYFIRLPYVNYYGGTVEAYLGWRPSGGFGAKFVLKAS